MKHVYIGTSGYNYKHWKGIFYPEHLSQKDWLRFYTTQFKTVEINATFYGSFTKAIVRRWYESTPKDFLFSIKGTRYVTHLKRLNDTKDAVKRFFDQLSPLKEKLGVVLWQFPENFTLKNNRVERLECLELFLENLPVNIRQAVEFRDETWFCADVFNLLNIHNIALVINQAKKFPYYEAVTADFLYLRFHGPQALYSSEYQEEDIKYWAEKIKNYKKQGDVFAYFNNDGDAYAVKNARELKVLFKRN